VYINLKERLGWILCRYRDISTHASKAIFAELAAGQFVFVQIFVSLSQKSVYKKRNSLLLCCHFNINTVLALAFALTHKIWKSFYLSTTRCSRAPALLHLCAYQIHTVCCHSICPHSSVNCLLPLTVCCPISRRDDKRKSDKSLIEFRCLQQRKTCVLQRGRGN
jgi:hypothetical protein